MVRIPLADILALAPSKAISFELEQDGTKVLGFVLHHEGEYRAYVNRCAHIPVPLDWEDGDFLDQGTQLLSCKLHGALFRPTDGYCVSGPCSGRSLQALVTKIDGDFLEIAI